MIDRIIPKTRITVDMTPAPVLTNNMIIHLNDMVNNVPPQEFASYIASTIAAMAFVLHSSNPREQVKIIFDAIVNDASNQFDNRKKMLEKDQSSIIRLQDND